MFKLWELARIRFRLGQTGYKKLIFNWFWDWHEDWSEVDFRWRNNELKEFLKQSMEVRAWIKKL